MALQQNESGKDGGNINAGISHDIVPFCGIWPHESIRIHTGGLQFCRLDDGFGVDKFTKTLHENQNRTDQNAVACQGQHNKEKCPDARNCHQQGRLIPALAARS